MTAMEIFDKTKQVVTDNSPSILAALAVGGVVTTGLVAHSAGVKYGREDQERFDSGDPALTGKQKFELYWRSHLPIFLVAGTTVTCVIASAAISNRRNATLASMVTIGEVALREYKEKAREVLTKEKRERIDKELAQDKLDAQENKEVIFVGDGDVIMFEVLTGRTFKSSRLAVERAEVDINRRLLHSDYISQNEWYDEIGLSRVAMGDEQGWNHAIPLEVVFIPLIKDDKPVLGVDYRFHPSASFDRLN